MSGGVVGDVVLSELLVERGLWRFCRDEDSSASGTEAECACEPPSDGPRPGRMREESLLLGDGPSSGLNIRGIEVGVEAEFARRRAGSVVGGEGKAGCDREGAVVGVG